MSKDILETPSGAKRVVKVVVGMPPEWIMDGCMSKFRIDVNSTVWAYQDTIYNPSGGYIADHLRAHEETHLIQQANYVYQGEDASLADTVGAEGWWKRYLVDAEFRLEQEIQAYGVQYAFYCRSMKDRNDRNRFVLRLAGHLSSPLYQVAISGTEALAGIKAVAKVI